MGQKALTIYTPSSAEPHITAEDDAFIFNSIFKGESGILGSLACVKIDTSTVRLSGGGVIYNGRILWIPTGQTLDLSIVGGVINRIVAEFTAGGGDTADTLEFKVVQGTEASSLNDAQRPTLTQNNIAAGGAKRQEALYEVVISGTTITEVNRIADYIGSFYA